MQRRFPSQVFQDFNNDKECFALSHFIFTNQNYASVSVSSTVKVVYVVNYHLII